MRKELQDSTTLLEGLRKYCSIIRKKVLDDVESAVKGGFTYIDLDTLDDISAQISINKIAMLEKTVKKVRSAKTKK